MTTCMSLSWNLPLRVGGIDRWRWRSSRLPSAGKTQNNLDSSKKWADKEHTQLFDLNPAAPGGGGWGVGWGGGDQTVECVWSQKMQVDSYFITLMGGTTRSKQKRFCSQQQQTKEVASDGGSLPQSVIRNLYDGKRNLILVGFCWMIKQGGFLSSGAVCKEKALKDFSNRCTM